MAPSSNASGPDTNSEIKPPTDPTASSAFVASEMKRAFEDLARGEETATLLEASLTALESKLDAILASIDAADAADAGEGDKGGEAKSKPA